MKRRVLIVLITMLIVAGCIFLYVIKNHKSDDSSKVTITQYKTDAFELIKTINITSSQDLEIIEKFIQELRPLTDEQQVDLILVKEFVINYYDNIRIVLTSNNKYYCYYENKEKNISSLSFMPEGLLDFVLEKLK